MPVVRYKEALVRKPKGYCTYLTRDVMARIASETGRSASDLFDVLSEGRDVDGYVDQRSGIDVVVEETTTVIETPTERRRGRPKGSKNVKR